MSAQPEAGWYPMPGGGMRYWDGAEWSDIPAPPAEMAATPGSVAVGGSAVAESPGEDRSTKAPAGEVAKVSWWLSAAGLFLVPFAVLGLIGGLVARHRDRESEWQPAVGLGALSVTCWVALISLTSITGWQIVGAQVAL